MNRIMKKENWISLGLTVFNLFMFITLMTSALNIGAPKIDGLKSGFVFDPHGNVYQIEQKTIFGSEFYDLELDDYHIVVAEDSVIKFKEKRLRWKRSN